MANDTKNGTGEAATLTVAQQQHQEQVAALVADADQAQARSTQAREALQSVFTQASTALNIAQGTQGAQILQQALMAAFQWGGEAANASDHAAQRRKEVGVLSQIAKTNEDELKESRAHRLKEAEESTFRTKMLERIALSNEKLVAKLDSLLPQMRSSTSKIEPTSIPAGPDRRDDA